MTLIKKGGVFHAKFRDASGTRRTISTKQTDRDKAKAVVKNSGIAELEAAGQSGRLSREVVGRIITGKKMTVAKAVEPFKAWLKSRGRSPKLIAEVEITLGAWVREMKLDAVSPASVTQEQIAAWVNDPEKERGMGARQVALGHLHTFFSFLTANGWVSSDPSQAVGIDHSVLSHEQKEPGDRQPFTLAEVEQLESHLKSQLYDTEQDMIRIEKDENYTAKGREAALTKLQLKHDGLFFWLFAVRCSSTTGLRLSDIAGLEWRCFSAPGKLVVWMDKTNQRIEHNLPETLETMVTQIAVADPKYIFPVQRAIINNVKRRSLLSTTFTRLCRSIGIMGRSFHSLRHTFATQSHKGDDKTALLAKLADTLSMSEIKTLLGHASAKTTKKYVH